MVRPAARTRRRLRVPRIAYTSCYGADMTGRRRPLTPAEREHLTDLGAQRVRTRNDADDAVAARNDELRRLYLDGVGPTALAACIPGEPDPTFSMHRVTVDAIVRLRFAGR